MENSYYTSSASTAMQSQRGYDGDSFGCEEPRVSQRSYPEFLAAKSESWPAASASNLQQQTYHYHDPVRHSSSGGFFIKDLIEGDEKAPHSG
jgi:hypothetical protein